MSRLRLVPLDLSPMKTPIYGVAFAATLASLFAAVPSQPPSSPTSSAEDVVQLSPFTVDTSKDVGYKASNSISGTRTNVPIAEVPMNIQVVTSELLTDLAVQTPTE